MIMQEVLTSGRLGVLLYPTAEYILTLQRRLWLRSTKYLILSSVLSYNDGECSKEIAIFTVNTIKGETVHKVIDAVLRLIRLFIIVRWLDLSHRQTRRDPQKILPARGRSQRQIMRPNALFGIVPTSSTILVRRQVVHCDRSDLNARLVQHKVAPCTMVTSHTHSHNSQHGKQ
jgi:hypothetical protein